MVQMGKEEIRMRQFLNVSQVSDTFTAMQRAKQTYWPALLPAMW